MKFVDKITSLLGIRQLVTLILTVALVGIMLFRISVPDGILTIFVSALTLAIKYWFDNDKDGGK